MAAISLSDCKIHRKNQGGYEKLLIITPATADSADTIDLTDILTGRNIRGLFAWDSTDLDRATCTLDPATSIIELDAGGATTDHEYNVIIKLK